MLHDSRLPLEKSWQSLDLKRLPTKVVQQARALLEGSFLDRHENVLVFGQPGSGKTHLLSALGQELVRAGRKVNFRKCGLLVQELLAAKRDLKLPALLKRYSSYEALVLDDLGYVQQSREEMEVLFLLLAERYERGSVLLSSNLQRRSKARPGKGTTATLGVGEVRFPGMNSGVQWAVKKVGRPSTSVGGRPL